MVRFASKRDAAYGSDDDDDDYQQEDDDSDEDYGKPKKKKKATPAKKKPKGRGVRVAKSPRSKISQASSKKSRSSYDDGWGDYGRATDDYYYEEVKAVKKAAAANKRRYQQYDDEEQSDITYDDEEDDSDDDYRRRPAAPPAKKRANFKRTPAKTAPKKGRGRPPAKAAAKGRGRPPAAAKAKGRKKASKYYESDDDVVYSSTTKSGRKSTKKKRRDYVEDYSDSEEEEEESESESESEEEIYVKPKKKAPPKEQFPPIAEMVVESIKALKDNPKKGSTIGSVKETIALNWPVNMKLYDKRIKKFILKAVDNGTLIRTKGQGLRGRFTVAGWKPPKKKRKMKMTKWDKDDGPEYQPKKTARDEDKEKAEAELEERRQELKRKAEEKEMEKANRPKKSRPKNTQPKEWEVESVKGSREKDDKTYYQVKWVGWPKLTWEPEENLDGCQDLIDAYLELEEKKEAEKAEWQKLAKEKGIYEVDKILNVEIHHGKREFHVRWKGWGPEGDTMEPEDNLDCPDLIEKFMANHEKSQMTSTKMLREAPKKTVRMVDIIDDGTNASGVRRKKKRREIDTYGMRGGYRMSYVGMDD